MKPYIEYKGKTYEFESNFTLQKQFRKEYKNLSKKNKNNLISDFDLSELNKLQKELKLCKEEAKDLGNDEQEEKLLELLSKYPSATKILENDTEEDDFEELSEKYVRQMFEQKYPNEKEVFDEIVDEITKDKGIEYVISLFVSIVKTVFMNVVEAAPRQKTSFDWEQEKTN